MKGLINIKNKDDKCFKRCHVRFINPINIHPDRINHKHKEMEATLHYRGIDFPLKERDYEFIEERFNINVNVFGYDNRVFSIYASKKFNEQELNVLLISNEGKSHMFLLKT